MPSLTPPNTGKTYWRSLDHLADSPELRALLANEFPKSALELASGPTRRHFLKIMGASLALAGMTGCRRWPQQKVAPFAHRPEGRVPGTTEEYATAMELGGYAIGLVVSAFDGRPIKIEGNPLHPGSLGAATCFAQAAVLELYDPDRSRYLIERGPRADEAAQDPQNILPGGGRVRGWEDFDRFATQHFGALASSRGKGLAVLSETSMSPTLLALRQRWSTAQPDARWYEYESVSRDHELKSTEATFGQQLRSHVHFDQADVVVCLDADLLGLHPNALRYARDWSQRRDSADQGAMNRVYVAESSFSVTGGMADERLPIASSKIPLLAQEIARQLGATQARETELGTPAYEFIRRVVADLKRHGARAVVIAGRSQSVATHRICHRINEALGSTGKAITFTAEPDRPVHLESIRTLTREIEAGQVDTLLLIGGNPAYDAPADTRFASLLAKVPTRIHLSLYDNETSRLCTWHLPRAHFLECWGDARGWDGTISVVQPLIEPLYGGRSPIEVLARLINETPADGYSLVRKTFQEHLPGVDFEKRWRKVLHDGVLPDSAFPVVSQLSRSDREEVVISPPAEATRLVFEPDSPGRLEVAFRADRKLYDGRFANNGWLQELPDALSTLVWDNAALMSPLDANKLGLKHGQVISLVVPGPAEHQRQIEVPVFLMPGQAAGSISLALGYGRRAAGRVGDGVGFDAVGLRHSDSMHWVESAVVTPTAEKYSFACVQEHHIIDEMGFKERRHRVGELIREASLVEYKQSPSFVEDRVEHKLPLLQLWKEPHKPDEHRWAMAIDLNRCIGCQACTIACQAENNIPVVGKTEVARGREMHWIRVDRYFKGDMLESNPQVVHQPLTCHQCENAPCEQVCPVPATMHDTEGLNVMVYNRCVGTRYCANNCPYKVRRFNYFDFHSKNPRTAAVPWLGMPDSQQRQRVDPVKEMVFNPNVTVRMRGVMEKCTFCTQRIMAVKLEARNAGSSRPPGEPEIADGRIVPACAQTCPTQAIAFGDLNDVKSQVRQWHQHQRSYAVLEELNVRPRTKYLARVRNPVEQNTPAESRTEGEV